MGYKGRDIEVVSLNETQYLVAACDSCGAIGMKELDVVKVPLNITGRLTTRNALLEVMSSGAEPKIITVAISNEPEPTGEKILEGVKEELEAMGLDLKMAISTEKNMPTQQTGLGITVVGLCEKENLRIGRSVSRDSVFCLGLPKVGEEVASDQHEIVQGIHLKQLLKNPHVHDILPVGSQGIRKEAIILAESVDMEFLAEVDCPIDMDKSAGPSTCIIFTAPDDIQLEFKDISVSKVGKLNKRGS